MSSIKYYGSTDGRLKYAEEDLLEVSINESHRYKPTFVFYSKPDEVEPIHFGLELELNTPEFDGKWNAMQLLKGVNAEKRHFYCKRDGSLRTGFEFNSMPMSLEYLKSFDADDMNQLFSNANVFTSEECGFHIHISREFLDKYNARVLFNKSMYNILPFLLFISKRKNYNSVCRFTNIYGRSGNYSDYDDYDNDERPRSSVDYNKLPSGILDPSLPDNELRLYSTARYSAHTKRKANKPIIFEMASEDDRYSFINYNNEKTVEVRLFKGTTDWSYVLNVVSLLEYIVKLTQSEKICDSIYDILNDTTDYDLKVFIGRELENMERELTRAYWVNKRGLLFSAKGNYTLYRIPLKMAKAGDYCITNGKLESAIRQNRRYRDGLARSLENNDGFFEITKISDDSVMCVSNSWRDSNSRLVKFDSCDFDKLNCYRKVLYIFAPFIREDEPIIMESLLKRIYMKPDATPKYVKNNGVVSEFGNRVASAPSRTLDERLLEQLNTAYAHNFHATGGVVACEPAIVEMRRYAETDVVATMETDYLYHIDEELDI